MRQISPKSELTIIEPISDPIPVTVALAEEDLAAECTEFNDSFLEIVPVIEPLYYDIMEILVQFGSETAFLIYDFSIGYVFKDVIADFQKHFPTVFGSVEKNNDL